MVSISRRLCYPRLMAPPPRYRFQFGLQAMFVAVLVVAGPTAWVGHTLNWIQQRQAGRDWLDQHRVWHGQGSAKDEARPQLPWSLRVFHEQPLKRLRIGPNYAERFNLSAYRARVAEIERLFPECQILDTDASSGQILEPPLRAANR